MPPKQRAIFELDSLPSVKKFGEILEAGDRCPDFFFASVDGSTFDLSCFIREKLWIAFYRYGGCPICKVHFNEVLQIESQLRASGIRFVAVFDCSQENIPSWLASAAKKNIVCVSGDNPEFYDRFGIEKSWRKLFSPDTLSARIQAGFKGEKEEKVDGAFNRIPAHFLVNPGGDIRVAHYGRSAGDHLPWKDVWAFAKETPKQMFELITEDGESRLYDEDGAPAVETSSKQAIPSRANVTPLPAPPPVSAEPLSDFETREEPDVLFDFRTGPETFDVSYRWSVKEGQEAEFIKTWKQMQRSIRNKYEGILSAELSRTANGEFLASSKWENRDAWEKFWVTKENVIREVMILRFLIKRSTEPEFSMSIVMDRDDHHDDEKTEVMITSASNA